MHPSSRRTHSCYENPIVMPRATRLHLPLIYVIGIFLIAVPPAAASGGGPDLVAVSPAPANAHHWGGNVKSDDMFSEPTCRPFLGTPFEPVCARVYRAVESQLPRPCSESLLGSSFEHLALLSYSSGHILESVAILLGATAGNSSEDATFLSKLHLNDYGSPEDCADVQGAHYCLGQAPLVASLGLCLPQSCDSASVEALLANLTASIQPSTTTATTSSSRSTTGGAGSALGAVSFSCGNELRLPVDAGTVAVFSLIGALATLVLVGTALEHHHRQKRLTRHAKKKNICDGNSTEPNSSANTAPPSNPVKGGVFNDSGDEHLQIPAGSPWAPDGVEEGRNIGVHQQQRQLEEEMAFVGRQSRGNTPTYSGDPVREPLLVPKPVTSPDGPVDELSTTGAERPRTGDNSKCETNGGTAWWYQCLECFSLLKNTDKLLAPQRLGNEFSALDGVRTLSMLWVVLGHTLIFAVGGPGYSNTIDILPEDGEGLLSRLSAQVFPGGFFAVDTFFLMSGFLLSSVLLPKLDSGSLGKCLWMGQAYLHRYLRLTPTLAFVMFITWKVVPRIGDGPIWWPIAIAQEDSCSKYWWAELTYFTNVIPWPPLSEGCIAVSWYLSNDTMFFAAGVPLVALYHRRPRVGVAVALLITTVSCGYTLFWFGFREDVRFSLFSVVNGAAWTEAYAAPWARCPVYFIGVLCGFVWHAKFRGRVNGFGGGSVNSSICVNDDRSTTTTGGGASTRQAAGVDDNSAMKRHGKAMTPLAAAVASAALLAIPVYGSYWAYQDDVEYNVAPWMDHLYLAFSRPTWALGVALMCGLCFCGHGGLVSWFLTRPGWTITSRLTYCAYLTHPLLMVLFYGTQNRPVKLTALSFSVTYMGLALGTFAGATALHLLVEAPFRNLESWARHSRGRKAGR